MYVNEGLSEEWMSNRFSVDGPGWCQGLGRIEKIEKIEKIEIFN